MNARQRQAELLDWQRQLALVFLLREFSPFARPFGERGRPIEPPPSYLQPSIPRPRPVPRIEELRVRRRPR